MNVNWLATVHICEKYLYLSLQTPLRTLTIIIRTNKLLTINKTRRFLFNFYFIHYEIGLSKTVYRI